MTSWLDTSTSFAEESDKVHDTHWRWKWSISFLSHPSFLIELWILCPNPSFLSELCIVLSAYCLFAEQKFPKLSLSPTNEKKSILEKKKQKDFFGEMSKRPWEMGKMPIWSVLLTRSHVSLCEEGCFAFTSRCHRAYEMRYSIQ